MKSADPISDFATLSSLPQLLLNSVMPKSLMLLYVFLLATTTTLNSQQQEELFFEGFRGATTTNNITTHRWAQIQQDGILRLTNDTPRVVGQAYHSKPIQFKNPNTTKVSSFSTAFAFAITNPGDPKHGGHGFAFIVFPLDVLRAAYPAYYLGLLNGKDDGKPSNHVFAVEFDTYKDQLFGDINDNHVGINLNSMRSTRSVPASTMNGKQELDLKSGTVIQAWVDYDSSSNQLDVRFSANSSKPISPILSYEVDLSPILEDSMYVGFSSSTGTNQVSSHYILGWSFKMNGEAKSLNLGKLPPLPNRSNKKSKKSMVILGVAISSVVTIAAIGLLLALFYLRKMKKLGEVIEPWELEVGPHRFSYKELKRATCGFKDKNLIGFGGFGSVYKGLLQDTDTQIAVKRISKDSKQGWPEFISEIATIGKLRHRSLVQLLGWCRNKSELLLVYDFMPNGSLDKYLFGNPKTILSWEQRFSIIKGVASGLLYLHEEWEQAVIHRDKKAGNILLDSEMKGRLGDFGLAKLYDHGSNPSTTRVVGTLGYLAPELTRTGKPTTSSDVYAFGATLLEIACGRRPFEAKAMPEELILVDWVRDRWRVGSGLDVVDPKLGGKFDMMEALVVLKLGLICLSDEPKARPNMRQVVMYLEGEVALPEVVEAAAAPISGESGGGGGGGAEGFIVHWDSTTSYHENVSQCCSVECDGDAPSSLSLSSGLEEKGS